MIKLNCTEIQTISAKIFSEVKANITFYIWQYCQKRNDSNLVISRGPGAFNIPLGLLIILLFCLLQTLDSCTCSVTDLQFSQDFTLTATREGQINAIVGYFDIFFHKGCSEQVMPQKDHPIRIIWIFHLYNLNNQY